MGRNVERAHEVNCSEPTGLMCAASKTLAAVWTTGSSLFSVIRPANSCSSFVDLFNIVSYTHIHREMIPFLWYTSTLYKHVLLCFSSFVIILISWLDFPLECEVFKVKMARDWVSFTSVSLVPSRMTNVKVGVYYYWMNTYGWMD